MMIVHVIPSDLARGAQTYLRALHKQLDGGPDEHRMLTLFGSQLGPPSTDSPLARPGVARRVGFDPRAALRLRRALRDLRPDVVVCHGGEGLKYVAFRPRGIRVVYYKIGTVKGELSPLRRHLYVRLARRTDVVAAVSNEAAGEIRRLLGSTSVDVVVIPNGRDPDQYRPPASRQEQARLVFVGHLTPGKRPHLFLEVVQALRAQGLALESVVVGDGPLESSVRQEAAATGTEVLGRQADVAPILASSHILVFTSLADGEGMPGVLIEAGLSGIPVVATDVPGARAVVEDGVTGFVVGLEDHAGLIEATRRLVADPRLQRKMGAAARQRCLAAFTMKASGQQWQQLFDRLGGRQRDAGVNAPVSEAEGRPSRRPEVTGGLQQEGRPDDASDRNQATVSPSPSDILRRG